MSVLQIGSTPPKRSLNSATNVGAGLETEALFFSSLPTVGAEIR
ncbi:hypothetical protein OG894_42490 (plasmid) [Streptomyces sp. NBC_01724]|nr:hypothetical protein [Streptomyces sp. NBC_01724]